MAFTYAYTPPTGMEPLPTPSVGATGHFDHHESLDDKINNLANHLAAQFGILTGALTTEFDTLEAPTLDYEAAIAAIQAAVDAALPKAGGTMTGDIVMSGGKTITGLPAADANGEAVRYEQLATKLDTERVIGGSYSATTDGSGKLTVTLPSVPSGLTGWAVTAIPNGTVATHCTVDFMGAGYVRFNILGNSGPVTSTPIGIRWIAVAY